MLSLPQLRPFVTGERTKNKIKKNNKNNSNHNNEYFIETVGILSVGWKVINID